MEDECQKSFAPSNVALVAREVSLREKGPFVANRPRKVKHAPQNSQPGKGIAKKQQAKGNGDKSIACVKCYNCGRKGHYT